GENDQGGNGQGSNGLTSTSGSSNSWTGNAGGDYPEFASSVGASDGSAPNFSAPTFTPEFSLQIDQINNPDTDQDLAPEPSSLMMIGLGLIGLTGTTRRRRK